MGDNFIKIKTILATNELYGVIPSTFIGMPYEDAIALKVKLAEKELGKLMKNGSWITENHKVNTLLSARNHNSELLEEIGLRYQRNNK